MARLREAYAALPPGIPVRLAKHTSNLFRFRDGDPKSPKSPKSPTTSAAQLDVSAFGHVLRVDPARRTAWVGGMTTYEDLADATLGHGLMPKVVPQLKTITLGGAVTGLGIESTSLRNGLPHESVTEMEILTGDGRVLRATADNEHADLFRGFPNSYGTLGYALSLTIELEPVHPSCTCATSGSAARKPAWTPSGRSPRRAASAATGPISSTGPRSRPASCTSRVGAFSDVAPWRSDYTGQQIYYQSIRRDKEDFLTIRDYLWRWDTDWFWCSRAFGVQRPLVRRLWPRRYRRSDVYRKLVALDQRYGLTDAMDSRRRSPAREFVTQDVEIPLEHGADFLRFFAASVGMAPVWICPLRDERAWPLYPLEPGEVYVNFGFWGTVALPEGRSDGYYNRLIEDEVAKLDGHKSLYSTAFYPEDEFYRRYNGEAYRALKRAYDGEGRLLGLYEKCVRGR